MTIARNIPVFDGHNDTLLRLYQAKAEDNASFFVNSGVGHLDLPRALEGGLGGGFFAIFTPNLEKLADYPGSKVDGEAYEFPLPPPLEQPHALQVTLAMAALLFKIEAKSEGKVKVVRTTAELSTCLHEGIFAAIFHIEGAEAIDTNLDVLYVLHQAGLRSLGPVWSRPTAFGHGVPFKFPTSPDTGPGLTDAGRALVQACNKLGILIDLSHLNEQGFWDVARLSNAPLVATHSGAHACCASARNLTDKQLDAIAESGGMVGVNFHVGFLRADGRRDADTPLSEIARHAAYIANRIGVDHVGLGSDFDGATMPLELKDAAGLPKLMTALGDYGFDAAALEQIAYKNWLRVLSQTWR